jgi:hypothetical protein
MSEINLEKCLVGDVLLENEERFLKDMDLIFGGGVEFAFARQTYKKIYDEFVIMKDLLSSKKD